MACRCIFLSPQRRAELKRRLDQTLCAVFHERVRAGDVETLRWMLEREPLLAQARNEDRETSLFMAAVHPESVKAVEMIDLLMEKGAVLGSRDRHWRHVLLYACHHGVEWEVVACLVKWNSAKGGGILKWPHCDDEARSSLVLACEGGHTRLALRILDEIDEEEYTRQSHPFRVLEAAISAGNEAHAVAIGMHPKVDAGARDMHRYKGYTFPVLTHTVATCTEAAVRRNMSSVVLLLNNLNHDKVCKAVWYSTREMMTSIDEDVEFVGHPEISGVADEFVRDWRWAQVKTFFLLRYRGQTLEDAAPELQSHLLVRLPDPLFCLTIDFLGPRDFFLTCGCIESSSGGCPWHSYSPNANDFTHSQKCATM